MIDRASYELEWIRKVSASLDKKGDPKLLEKVIYAFTLLEQIVVNKLDFIFKGGTSLLLSTNPPRRFSIDNLFLNNNIVLLQYARTSLPCIKFT
jgi:hypothetical protein